MRIYIYSGNFTAKIRNRATPRVDIELPDCSENTKDLQFCQKQEVSVMSKPVGLRVHNISTLVDTEKSTPVGMFTVSWHPPVQLPEDRMIGEFEVWVIRSDSHQFKRVKEVVVPTLSQMMYTNPFDVSFEQSFQMDVPYNWTEDIEITVQGFLNSGNKSCRTYSLCSGRTAFLLHHINIITEPPRKLLYYSMYYQLV